MTTHLAPIGDADHGLAVGQRISNYRIERLLSDGGMGLVFEARHLNTGGRAAVKILRAEVACRQDVVARFFNEARATTAVEHPGIVRIFDCGYSAEGVAYLAMEFLDGESLGERLDRERQLAQSEALRIGRQIASAMRAAHAKGIIHRDLKPDNVMVVPDAELPSGERVKVVDFGIAKVTEGAQVRTQSGVVLGTPRYMSPEQCRSAKNVTDRADVYSLGVMLYEMLSGQPPFDAEQVGDLLGMHMTGSPPPLSQIAPAIGMSVGDLVMAMLAKDPLLRPSMEEVTKELSRLLGSEDSLRSEPVGSDAATQRRISLPSPVVSRSSAFSPSLRLPPELRALPDELTVHEPQILLTVPVPPSSVSDPVAELLRPPAQVSSKKPTPFVSFAGAAAVAISGWLLLHFFAHPRTVPPDVAPTSTAARPPLPMPPAPAPPTKTRQEAQQAPALISTPAGPPTARVIELPAARPTVHSLREQAEQQFRDKRYDDAIKTAIVLKGTNSKRAAFIIGRSACHLEIPIPALANQAIADLMDIEAQDTEVLIDRIYADCKARGLLSDIDGKIQPAPHKRTAE